MIVPRPVGDEAVARALSSHPSRIILSRCIRAPASVKHISEQTGLPIASVYRHVAHLVDQGVLVVERSAITPEGKAYDLYRSRIRKARIELGPDRVGVEWEPNEAVEDRIATLWERLGG